MDKTKNSFFNSNLGKYLTKHPDVAEVYLTVTPPKSNTIFEYQLYMFRNHKIDRYDDPAFDDYDEQKDFCRGQNTDFPKYFICKGAVIVDNLYETPDFLQQH